MSHPTLRFSHVGIGSAENPWWPRLFLLVLAPVVGLTVALAPAPSALAAIAGGGLLVVTIRPQIGWYAVAVLATPVAVAQAGQSWLALAFAAAAGATSLIWIVTGPRTAGQPTLAAPRVTVALVCFLALSIGWSAVMWPISDAARSLVITFLVIGGPILVALAVLDEDGLTRRIQAWFVIGTVATALVSMAGSIAASRALISAPVVELVSANHNLVGLLYVLGVATALARERARDTFVVRLAAALAAAILSLAILDTFSRSSIMALAAVAIAYAHLRGFKALLAGLTIATMAVALVPDALWVHLTTSFGAGGLGPDLSSTVRLDLWSAASRMFADSPLLGVGFRGFAYALPQYWNGDTSGISTLTDPTNYVYAHNILLTLLSTTGLFGLALTTGFVAVVARPGFDRAGSHDRVILVLVGAGVASMFGEPLLLPSALVAFLLLMKSPLAVRTNAGSNRRRSPRV